MEIRIYGSDSPLSGGTKYENTISGTSASFDTFYGDISNTTGVPSGFITGGTNAGSIGEPLFKKVTDRDLEFYRLSGGTNTTLTVVNDEIIKIDTNIPSEYLTTTEGDTRYVNVSGDTINGDLSIVGQFELDFGVATIKNGMNVTGDTIFYASGGEVLLDITPGNNEIEFGRSLLPDANRSLSIGDGTHFLNSIWTTDIRLGDNSGDDAITITAPSNIFPSSPDPVYGIVVPQTTGGTGSFLGVYNYDGGNRSHETGWFTINAGSNILLTTNYAASGSTLTIDTTGLGSGTVSGATNIGGGTEIFSSDVNNSLQFRTLTGASPYKITTVVNGDKVELDIDEPKMTLWPLVVTGNKLISGGAAYLSGLDFSISPLVYIIGDTIYNYSGGTVTLTSGDTTYSRIDVIYADNNSTVGVIEGTPAPNPSKPELTNDQVEITFVAVAAGASSPEVTITKIYDEGTGTLGGEWDPSTNNPTTILTGSTGQAFSGTKSVEFALANTGDYVNFNIPAGYDTSNDNILSFYMYVPSSGSWDSNRDLRIKLYSGTTIVGGGSTTVSFGDSGNFGFDPNNTDAWQVVSISLGSFVLTQPTVTDVRFEVISLGNPAGNTIDAYLDLVRFQQGAATVSPQNLWLSFKTDDNIVTIAETNNEQLTVIGGTNIQTTGNNSSKSLTIDLTTGIDATYIGNGSVTNTEFEALSGVTSDIQLQLDSKVDTNTYVTGGTLNGNSIEIGRTDSSPILTLSGASNITITNPLTDTFLIQSTDTGEVNTASNVGVGTGIFSGKSNSDLQFYSISGGTNIDVTLNNNTLVIDSIAGGSALTVKDIDGSPTVNNVSTIEFTNGTVSDQGGGTVRVVVSGGTGGSGLGDEAKIFSWFMNVT